MDSLTSLFSTLLAHPVYVLALVFFASFLWQRLQPFPEDDEPGAPEKITSLESFKSFRKMDKIIVVDFYATWCPPCRIAAPIFSKMAKEPQFSNRVIFLKCDVDKAPDVSRECGISAMPTFKVFQNDKEILSIQGWNEGRLRNAIDDLLSNKKR